MNSENRISSGSKKRGRAVLVGVAKDSADGHVRLTKSSDFKLYGGSEEVHQRMLKRAEEILTELEAEGICLDTLTYEQYLIVADRFNSCQI